MEFNFFLEEPLWGNAFYEELFLIQIYNSTGVLGLISGFLLYIEGKSDITLLYYTWYLLFFLITVTV